MDWRVSTWGDEISLEYGKGIRGYGEKKTGKFRVFGSNGPVGWTDDFLAPGPGVILGRKGAYRGVRYSSDPFFVIDTAYYVRPKKDLHMRWLYYAVIHHKLGEIDDGSPIPSTTRAAVYVRELCVPTPHEQEAIADVLGALDDKIELNRRLNETLEAIARAIFKDWFVDFGPTRAKMEGRAPYLAPDLWALFPDNLDEDGKPEGWRHSTVDQEFNLTMGQSPPGDTYNYRGEGTPFYQGRTDFGFRFPSLRMYCTAPKRIAAANDTLISVRAPVGDLNMAREECCIGRGLAAARHKTGGASFTYYAIDSIRPAISAFEHSGTVFGAITKDQFAALAIICPPPELIEMYENVARPLDSGIRNNTDESQTLAQTRDLLLPKLMSGEIHIKDVEPTQGETI